MKRLVLAFMLDLVGFAHAESQPRYMYGWEMLPVSGCTSPRSEDLTNLCAVFHEEQGRLTAYFRACVLDPAAPECSVFNMEMRRAQARAAKIDVMNQVEVEKEPKGDFLGGPIKMDRWRTTFAGDIDTRTLAQPR